MSQSTKAILLFCLIAFGIYFFKAMGSLEQYFNVSRDIAVEGAVNSCWAILLVFIWAFLKFSIARIFYAIPFIVACALVPIAVQGYGFSNFLMVVIVCGSMGLSWYLDQRFGS